LTLPSTRYYAAVIVAALALGACSGSPQQSSSALPATNAEHASSALATHRHSHGVPGNCDVVETSSTGAAVVFSYHKNEPQGSYGVMWEHPAQIKTVWITFAFYDSKGNLVDSFYAPPQDPVISSQGLFGWNEFDVQPDYDPAGSVRMVETITGSLVPFTQYAQVKANFVCN
jgi:hypothetical protein